METILPISLKLNITPNTLGSHGLNVLAKAFCRLHNYSKYESVRVSEVQ